MITVSKITNLVNEKIEGTDLFLAEVKVKPGNIIYVFLDGDSGVSISKCVEISRHIEGNLDRDKDDFELHVSSYGLGEPLKFFRQYVNAVGKELSVMTLEGEKHTGKLLSAEQDKIVLRQQGKKKKDPAVEISIAFEDIKVAKIMPVFSKQITLS